MKKELPGYTENKGLLPVTDNDESQFPFGGQMEAIFTVGENLFESRITKRRAWTEDEETLRLLVSEGKSNKEIAEALGRSIHSINAKKGEMGLTDEKTWTDDDIDRLRTLTSEGKSNMEIAEALGRTIVSINGRKCLMGLTDEKIWTDDDIGRLRTLNSEGKSAKEIAEALGRTVDAIRAKKSKMGLIDDRTYTDEEKASIVTLTLEGKSVKDIAETLARSFGSVKNKKRALGIPDERTWSDEDEDRLITLTSESKSAKVIAETLGRTVSSVKNKKRQLGLTAPHSDNKNIINEFGWETLSKDKLIDLASMFGNSRIPGLAAAMLGMEKQDEEFRSQLAEHLGLLTLPQKNNKARVQGVDWTNIADVLPYLPDTDLAAGMGEVVKDDGLMHYYEHRNEGLSPEESFVGYFTAWDERIARLEDQEQVGILRSLVNGGKEYWNQVMAIPTPPCFVSVLTEGRRFLDLNQQANIKEMEDKRAVLIADGVGTGKSAADIADSELYVQGTKLIIPPHAVESTWLRYLSERMTNDSDLSHLSADEQARYGGYTVEQLASVGVMDSTGRRVSDSGLFRPGMGPRVLQIDRDVLDLLETGQISLEDYAYVILSQEKLGMSEYATYFIEQGKAGRIAKVTADESHNLNSLDGVRADNFLELCRHIPRRTLMSATPALNFVSDMARHLQFLYPETLGALPVQQLNQMIVDGRTSKGETFDINVYLFPRMTRRSSDQVLTLPPATDSIRMTVMSPHEERVYQMLLDEPMPLLSKIHALRQFENGVARITPEFGTAKRRLLESVIAEQHARGRQKGVVFSNGTAEGVIRIQGRDTIPVPLPEGVTGMVLHGKTSDKEGVRSRFQTMSESAVLFTNEAGREGIDLSTAEYGVMFSQPWNQSRIDQQWGRIHRQGQTNPVEFIDLIVEGTFGEGMYTYLREKHDVLSRAIDGLPLSRYQKTLFRNSQNADKELELVGKAYQTQMEQLMQLFGETRMLGVEKFEQWSKEMRNSQETAGEVYARLYRNSGRQTLHANANAVNATVITHLSTVTTPKILSLGSAGGILDARFPDIFPREIHKLDLNGAHFYNEDERNHVGSMHDLSRFESGCFDFVECTFADVHLHNYSPKNDERLRWLSEAHRVLYREQEENAGHFILHRGPGTQIRDKEAFDFITSAIGFEAVPQFTGEVRGAGHRSDLFTWQAKPSLVQGYENLKLFVEDEKLVDGLKLDKVSAGGGRKEILDEVAIGGVDLPLRLSSYDRSLRVEEQSAYALIADWRKQFADPQGMFINHIPDSEILNRNFVRVSWMNQAVLMKELRDQQGYVSVRE